MSRTAERLQSAGLGYLASGVGSIGADTIQCELGGAASSMTFIEPRALSSDLVTRSARCPSDLQLADLAVPGTILAAVLGTFWRSGRI